MYYRAIKMSNQVFIKSFNEVTSEAEDIEELINAGDTVVLSDDPEEIADHFDIEVEDLITVEDGDGND